MIQQASTFDEFVQQHYMLTCIVLIVIGIILKAVLISCIGLMEVILRLTALSTFAAAMLICYEYGIQSLEIFEKIKGTVICSLAIIGLVSTLPRQYD